MLTTGLRTRRSGFLVANSVTKDHSDVIRSLVDYADAGGIRPVIDREYPLDEIVEAHRYVDTGRKRGNVVLRVG